MTHDELRALANHLASLSDAVTMQVWPRDMIALLDEIDALRAERDARLADLRAWHDSRSEYECAGAREGLPCCVDVLLGDCP